MTADFSRLFRQHAPFVWRVLRRFGVPERDLEDACQEVFMVVLRRESEFEQRASERTWLYGIARRVASTRRRTAKSRNEHIERMPHEPCATADEQEQEQALDRTRTLRWLEQELALLDHDKREAFVLYELERMTLTELAEATRCNETTALYRLDAARRELRKRLSRRGLLEGAQKRAADMERKR